MIQGFELMAQFDLILKHQGHQFFYLVNILDRTVSHFRTNDKIHHKKIHRPIKNNISL